MHTKKCPVCEKRGRVGRLWATVIFIDHATDIRKTYTMHKECMGIFMEHYATLVG